MTTELGGTTGLQSIVGFGSSVSATAVGGTLDITSLGSNAFSMPRDGSITAISAYTSSTTALALVGTSVTITAQLYASATPDDLFTAIPGAVVTLAPALTGIVGIGTVSSGITTGLAIPVTAQTRLMLVFTAQVIAGIDLATVITFDASAGVTIQ